MENQLIKHVVKCMQCDFQILLKNYDRKKEQSFLEIARQHCKEEEHTVMTQT